MRATVLAAARVSRYLIGRMTQANLKTDLRAIVGDPGLLEGAAVRERAAVVFHGHIDSDLLVALSTDNGANWSVPAPLNTTAASDR